jgi:hypothetical protein
VAVSQQYACRISACCCGIFNKVLAGMVGILNNCNLRKISGEKNLNLLCALMSRNK